MGARDYGPIPRGVWDLEGYVLASRAARGLFLAILGVCSYRGRFHRSPRLLARQIADDDWRTLDPPLDELEALGLIESWDAPPKAGSAPPNRGSHRGALRVGSVVDYWDLPGLPKDRRNKCPKTPDFPDGSPKNGEGSPESGEGSPKTGDRSPLGKGRVVKGREAKGRSGHLSRLEDSRAHEGAAGDPKTPALAHSSTSTTTARERMSGVEPPFTDPAPTAETRQRVPNLRDESVAAGRPMPGTPGSRSRWSNRTEQMQSLGALLGDDLSVLLGYSARWSDNPARLPLVVFCATVAGYRAHVDPEDQTTAVAVYRKHCDRLDTLSHEHGLVGYLERATSDMRRTGLDSGPHGAIPYLERLIAEGGPTKRELAEAPP